MRATFGTADCKTIICCESAISIAICALLGLFVLAPLAGAQPVEAAKPAVVGWRGDGSGNYPDSNPPIHWGKTAATLQQLRAQAAKPAENSSGEPIADGVIRQWLVLGPVPWDEESHDWSKDLLPGENDLSPDENQKTGTLTWKKVTTETACLDFCEVLGIRQFAPAVAYAHAYIHCDNDQAFRLYVPVANGSKVKIALNGHELTPHVCSTGALRLTKGWNRLLLRVSCANAYGGEKTKEASWYLRPLFRGADGCQYKRQNIRWATPLPGWSVASPIVVGDKVFTLAEERTLCCLSKDDGKILWTHTTTFFDAATPEERAAHPEEFKAIAPLAARLAEIDAAPGTSPLQIKEKRKLEKQINRMMSAVDPDKYNASMNSGEPGTSVPTPTSDGRNVYVDFQPCVAACFDLEGRRKWTYVHTVLFHNEHGQISSPHLVDGKLLLHADQLVALDAATGKPVWTMPREYFTSESDRPKAAQFVWEKGYLYRASLADVTIGGQRLIVTPVNVLRAADGHILGSMHEPYGNFIPTSIVDGRRIYRLGTTKLDTANKTNLDIFELPADPVEPFEVKRLARVEIDATRFPRNFDGRYQASPLYHDGLVYCVNSDGVLSVVDAEKHEVVYQRFLDLDWMVGGGPARGGCGASPALAGKHLFIFGNTGTCVVIRTGRRFEQVAKNSIELISNLETSPSQGRLELTVSCPVFDGSRLYYRGVDYLYCLEEGRE